MSFIDPKDVTAVSTAFSHIAISATTTIYAFLNSFKEAYRLAVPLGICPVVHEAVVHCGQASGVGVTNPCDLQRRTSKGQHMSRE